MVLEPKKGRTLRTILMYRNWSYDEVHTNMWPSQPQTFDFSFSFLHTGHLTRWHFAICNKKRRFLKSAHRQPEYQTAHNFEPFWLQFVSSII